MPKPYRHHYFIPKNTYINILSYIHKNKIPASTKLFTKINTSSRNETNKMLAYI